MGGGGGQNYFQRDIPPENNAMSTFMASFAQLLLDGSREGEVYTKVHEAEEEQWPMELLWLLPDTKYVSAGLGATTRKCGIGFYDVAT